ncbi:MAG: hypothetical protein ABTQ25_10910 [Nitrosomonas ureae]
MALKHLIACTSFTPMRIQDSRCLHTISVRKIDPQTQQRQKQEICIQVTDWQNYTRPPRFTLTNRVTATIIQLKRTQKQHGEIV